MRTSGYCIYRGKKLITLKAGFFRTYLLIPAFLTVLYTFQATFFDDQQQSCCTVLSCLNTVEFLSFQFPCRRFERNKFRQRAMWRVWSYCFCASSAKGILQFPLVGWSYVLMNFHSPDSHLCGLNILYHGTSSQSIHGLIIFAYLGKASNICLTLQRTWWIVFNDGDKMDFHFDGCYSVARL
jgi:hypothetical protein